MTATASSMDGAFSAGDLPLADAVANVLMIAGCLALHEAFEMALARYRSKGAGHGGHEFPDDPRAQAAVDLARALGIEMSSDQRGRFWLNLQAGEVWEAVEGHRAAGYARGGAIDRTAATFGITVDQVQEVLAWFSAPSRLPRPDAVTRSTDGVEVACLADLGEFGGCDYDH